MRDGQARAGGPGRKNKMRARKSRANMLFLFAERSRRVLTRSILARACANAVLFCFVRNKSKKTRQLCDSSSGLGLCHRLGGNPIITSRELYHANNSINSVTIDLLQLTPILPILPILLVNT